MIHDVLLACYNLTSDDSILEEFLQNGTVSKLFNHCEQSILKDIIAVVSLLRNVARFSHTYSTQKCCNSNVAKFETGEPLQNGLYLQSFANGVQNILDDFRSNINKLEIKYLKHPTYSLMLLYHTIYEYGPLATYLTNLINGVCSKRLHGCIILQHLQQNSLHCDKLVVKAIQVIQKSVNVVFLRQLINWLLYAKTIDAFGEFFIQSTKCNGSSGGAATAYVETFSNYADIWRYEVCYKLLPRYLKPSWAEKVLFIGQTVLIFKLDKKKQEQNAYNCNKSDHLFVYQGETFWNGNENTFYAKIQSLLDDKELITSHYADLIKEISHHVTNRLSEIALNQADLVQQLRLLKDFFLLGRGELYMDFIRRMYDINKIVNNTNKLLDFVRAFEAAAHLVGASDELEQFSLCSAKTHNKCEESIEYGFLYSIELEHKINWPLHLIISPKVLERYNLLFRFLLHIKKMQYDLHNDWCKSTTQRKSRLQHSIKVMQLRNELMFFIDNFQYYLHIDVIENHFRILLKAVSNQNDFERIQKAHSVFLTYILTLSLILQQNDVEKTKIFTASTIQIYTPVHLIINDILQICNVFCHLIDERSKPSVAVYERIDYLHERLGKLIQQLITLLNEIKTATGTAPLAHFLLRLDYTHWYSRKENEYLIDNE